MQISDTARRVIAELHARYDVDTLTSIAELLITWRANINQIVGSQVIETCAYTGDATACSICRTDIPKDDAARTVRYRARGPVSVPGEYTATVCRTCHDDLLSLVL